MHLQLRRWLPKSRKRHLNSRKPSEFDRSRRRR
ncbi:unnamed protein product [Nippostrongylus brasiliensis]|uniref:Uncharacterized protein n=1 Tax=Nippostrongylus brasiliensis TaxID=27835 RepID=A0A0N4XR50_NIPBR|nr:unnamed protein product [Nippostrongylus brasiliensis]